MEIMQPCGTADIAKRQLRREMLARRKAFSPEAAAAASAAVTARVLELPGVMIAREVLAYLPVQGEVDTRPVIGRLLAEGRTVLLPRCRDDAPGRLDLGPIACLAEAVPGHFGIPEPPADSCRPPETFAPDVILVPGLAFDLTGGRLGFGGGYYDRLLALPMAAGALLAGLGYAFQMVPSLPCQAWDRSLDAVVTDQATHWFGK